MSKPFAQVVAERAELFEDAELTERAFAKLNRWSLMSSDKLVSLDEVAWVGAVLLKGLRAAGAGMQKHETVDENGARVVSVTASDGVRLTDGAA